MKMTNEKKWHFCELCGLEEHCNRGKNHHIIPRRIGTNSHVKIWLCKGGHMILHKAEGKGIVKMPNSNEEYKKWKEEAKEIKHNE